MRMKIIALAAALMFLASCTVIPTASDDSSAYSETYVFTITETLYFGDQASGDASVKKINDAAKADVCEYSDDCLTFTKNVDMTLYSSSSDKGLIVFNGSSTQTIRADKDVKAVLRYIDDMEISSGDVGAVMKTGNGNLALGGSGDLYIRADLNEGYAAVCSKDINFVGDSYIYSENNSGNGAVKCRNVYVETGSDTYIESKTDGIVMTGQDLYFEKCDFKIKSNGYSFRCPNITNITAKRCNAEMISANKTAFSKGPDGSYMSLCTVYGSSDASYYEEIDLTSVNHYKHVAIKSQIKNDAQLYLVIGACITIPLIVIIALIYKFALKRDVAERRFSKKIKKKLADYPNILEKSKTSADGISHAYDEIMAQSLVEGASFALIVDGYIAGYIRDQASFFKVSPGKHLITIMTNDADRKKVLQKYIVVRRGMKITVSKNIGGYKVEFE